jgi:hypothetical protein
VLVKTFNHDQVRRESDVDASTALMRINNWMEGTTQNTRIPRRSAAHRTTWVSLPASRGIAAKGEISSCVR